jgi:hypothetical protein
VPSHLHVREEGKEKNTKTIQANNDESYGTRTRIRTTTTIIVITTTMRNMGTFAAMEEGILGLYKLINEKMKSSLNSNHAYRVQHTGQTNLLPRRQN